MLRFVCNVFHSLMGGGFVVKLESCLFCLGRSEALPCEINKAATTVNGATLKTWHKL